MKRILIALCLVASILFPLQAYAAPADVAAVDSGNVPVSESQSKGGYTLAAEINRRLDVDPAGKYVDVTLDVDIRATGPGVSSTMPLTGDNGILPVVFTAVAIVAAATLVIAVCRKKKGLRKITPVVMALVLLVPAGGLYSSQTAHAATIAGPNTVTEAFSQDMLESFSYDSILSSTGDVHANTSVGITTGLSWDVVRESHNQMTYRMKLKADVADASLNKEIPVTAVSTLDYIDLDGAHRTLDFPYISVILGQAAQPAASPYTLVVEHYSWDGTTATPISSPQVYEGLEIGANYQARSCALGDPGYTYLDHVVADSRGTWFAHTEQTEVTVDESQHSYTLKLYYGKPASFTVLAAHKEYAVSLNEYGSSPNCDPVLGAEDFMAEYLPGFRFEPNTTNLFSTTSPFLVYSGTTFETLLVSSGELFVGQSVDLEDYLTISDIDRWEESWGSYGLFNDLARNTYITSVSLDGHFPLKPDQTFTHVLTQSANEYVIQYLSNGYFVAPPPPTAE